MSVIGKSEGIEHGTDKGYNQHIYRGIAPCGPCKRAHSKAKQPQRAGSFDYPAGQAKKRAAQPPAAKQAPPPLPPSPYPPVLIGDAEIGTPVKGAELEVGDRIVHLGRRHRILRFEPYRGSLRAELGGSDARTAVCEGGLELPHGPHSNVYIVPRGESS